MAKIVLYGKKNCQQCKAMKRFLENNKLKYSYIDIEENSEALDRVKEYGFSTVPVTEIPLAVMSLQHEVDKEKSPVKRFGDNYVFSGFRPNLVGSLKIPT